MGESLLSQKQSDFLKNTQTGLNLGCGAIRSGKTFTHVLRILRFILHEAGNVGEILISAKRLDSVNANLIRPMRRMIDLDPVTAGCFKIPEDHGPIRFKHGDRDIVINRIGAHDEAAEERIRGMTLQAWFPDELTLHPEGYVKHAIGRLSAGARLMVGTTNPESRSHFVYQQFIASGRAKVWQFTLQDNPSLDPEYVKQVTEFYRQSPTYYARFILGEWAGDPDRQVIPEWHDHAEAIMVARERPQYFHSTVGMDTGMRDLTFVILGYYDFANDMAVVEDEIVSRGETTDLVAGKIKAKEAALGYDRPVRFSDVDLRLIEDLTRLHGLPFAPTRKDDKQAAINAVRMAVAQRKLAIHPRCENLKRHIDGAIWNERKTEYERTESEGHFDGLDALIYWYRNLRRDNPVPSVHDRKEWQKPDLFISPKIDDNSQDTEWTRAFGME